MARFALPVGLVFALCSTAAVAQYTPPDPNGLEGIIVETYYIADANDATDTDGGPGLNVGSKTYRVYVDMLPGYKLLTVGGFTNHPLTMSTSTAFFNNEDRGEAWGGDINDLNLDENTVAVDSWLTIGAASDAHWGVLKTADPDGSLVGGTNNDGGSAGIPEGLLANDTQALGVPLTTSDGLWSTSLPPSINAVGTAPDLFEPGGSNNYSNDNFAYAVLGGIGSPDSLSNRILIGQFTTDGVFSYCLNLFIKLPDSLVCPDPECHEFLIFYGNLLPADTAGVGSANENIFTLNSLCFDSSVLLADCEGVPGGPAQPGSACDDGNADTSNDAYAQNCDCLGDDCLGVAGGTALPGQPCDDGNPETGSDMWQSGCLCEGSVGVLEHEFARAITATPNPTNDLVRLSIDGLNGERTGYELIDLLGQRLLAENLGVRSGDWSGTIDMSGLPQGVYLLAITAGSRQHIERIVKL